MSLELVCGITRSALFIGLAVLFVLLILLVVLCSIDGCPDTVIQTVYTLFSIATLFCVAVGALMLVLGLIYYAVTGSGQYLFTKYTIMKWG